MQGRAPLSILIATLAAATLAAQSTPVRSRTPTILPIASITVTGNKTLSTDAILAVSGLKVHENGGPAIFDAARDRLLATGYFDQVGYTFRQQDAAFVIAFNVAEMKQVYPLHIEALPVTTDQVVQLLKAKDPLFNGLLPGTKQATDRAATAVEQYLASINSGLHVRARVVPASSESGSDRYEVLLTPVEGLPVIADAVFEGSKLIKDTDLHTVMIENGIGQPYSDAGIQALLDRVVRPLYEKQGYMAVTFSHITTTPDPKVKGLDVHITVDDGPRFRLGALSVRGEMAGDAPHIVRMAAIPRGEFANGDDIAQGATRIHDTLLSEGYLDVAVTTGRSINAAAKTVDVWFDVKPGAVYTFGHLEVLGLGLDGEAAIRKMWTVKPGDPFPGAYPERFVQGVKEQSLFDNLGDITATPSINHQTRVVDVSLHFATAPTSAQRRAAQ